MNQEGAEEEQPEGAQFEKDPREGYPSRYRGFYMRLRESYMH